MLSQLKERMDYFIELDKKNGGKKHHVLYIEPDYDCLLWEEDTVICGRNPDGFNFLYSENEDKYDVILEKDKEIDDWLYKFEECCLIPISTGEVEREELCFDWDGFHLGGLQIALRIANQLPPECELWYTTPYEDASETIPEAILVKKAV